MKSISTYIEQTNLKPIFTDADVYQLVEDATKYEFHGICLPPFWVKKAHREISGRDIKLVTVIGFPLGYNMTETKIEEAKVALNDGANELDMVMNISAFKSGMPWVKIEMAKLANLSHQNEAILKVIIETAYLSDDEIVKACLLCRDAGVDFVKTSTGFAPEGAKLEHIKLMRNTLPDHVGIKASGGIKDYKTAVELINAGANRIGTSSGVAIVEAARL
ncbi:deoxyribose-phosphate aldolase [Peijinzhouia sedimentorum]